MFRKRGSLAAELFFGICCTTSNHIVGSRPPQERLPELKDVRKATKPCSSIETADIRNPGTAFNQILGTRPAVRSLPEQQEVREAQGPCSNHSVGTMFYLAIKYQATRREASRTARGPGGRKASDQNGFLGYMRDLVYPILSSRPLKG